MPLNDIAVKEREKVPKNHRKTLNINNCSHIKTVDANVLILKLYHCLLNKCVPG